MPPLTPERVLVIGDADRQVQSTVFQVLPAAQVVSVASVFDGIAELTTGQFSTVLAAAEPIERRPETAVRTLRELTGAGRLVLFGHPTLEPLSRKMLNFGVDDYLITPAQPAELQQVFGHTSMRLADDAAEAPSPATPDAAEAPAGPSSPFAAIPMADMVLDALLQSPHDPVTGALRLIGASLGSTMSLRQTKADAQPIQPPDGQAIHSHPLRSGNDVLSMLHLSAPDDLPADDARHFLAQVAHHLGKLVLLQQRHSQLQKLAITDDLTGVYNGRYFRHFLAKIIDKARTLRFPVTLLLFDIDNFKKYNDEFGHTVGDDILKQTAALMKRSVREHDCVARISGDEFAVVFWEKEGPRAPHPTTTGGTPGRPPQTPLQIFERFRGLLNRQEFAGLGPGGKGVLTISAGLAVYPYDAQTPDDLYAAADKALMFGSKKAGKNALFLVGNDEPTTGADRSDED
jgi:GGDEF domain-containing protein